MSTAGPQAEPALAPTREAGTGRAVELDVLRAVAALAVLAIHAYALGGRAAPIKAQSPGDVPLIGLASGVWLFFAISGYVIGRPFVSALVGGRPLPALVPFALRRALRIYPLYWVVLAAFVAVAGQAGTRPWQLPFHVLLLHNLIPGRQEALFSPAWTLTLEVLFYVALPILAWRLRRRFAGPVPPARLARLIAAAWLASILFTAGVDLLGDGRVGLWLRFSLPSMWQMFCPGLLLAVAMETRAEPGGRRLWLAAGLLVPAAVLGGAAPLRWGVVPYELLSDLSRPLYAIAYGAILAAALGATARSARSERPPGRARMVLAELGLVSYGIYLIHPVIAELALHHHVRALDGHGPAALVLNALALAGITVPLAVLSWRGLERPALGLARRLGTAWREGQIAPSRSPAVLRRCLLGIVALALIVRVFVVLDVGHFVPRTDAADYDRIAVSLATVHRFPGSELTARPGPSAFRPPAFPVFLAGVYAVSGTRSPAARWRAGRLAEAGLGAVTVGLVGLIALELYGALVALLAAALAAVYPPLVLVGSSLMSESLFIPLVLGATLLALRARRRERAPAAILACGLLIGLAGMTRSVGLVVGLPLAALLTRPPLLSRRNLGRAAAAGLAAVAVLAPWTARNLSTFHGLVPVSTEGGFALAGTYNATSQHRRDYPGLWSPPVVQLAALTRRDPALDEAKLDAGLKRAGITYIEAHPAYVLEVVGLSALRMLDLPGPRLSRYEASFIGYDAGLTVLSVYAFWAVALLALAAIPLRSWRGVPRSLWLVPAVVLLAGCLFSGTQRYRAPADPFLLILAAAALGELTRRRRLPSPPA